MTTKEFMSIIKQMIDDLKALSHSVGLNNSGNEYKVISVLFTYKFINDKLKNEMNKAGIELEEHAWNRKLRTIDGTKMVKLDYSQSIQSLYNQQNEYNIAEILDNTLIAISEKNKEIYSIETANGEKKPLFEPITTLIESAYRNDFAKRAINILSNVDFSNMFSSKHDYYSTIFEYLIKDYNSNSGAYAEFYTPAFTADIIAQLLLKDDKPVNVKIYDPSAGSGTLLMHLAHHIGEDNCGVFGQDISQKSTDFLRMNLILNELGHSLSNIVQGNTLSNPAHKEQGELMKFDYITSNPPFKVDFSDISQELESDIYNRFFAGVPRVPKTKKDSMPIYLMFIQHILASLNENGKAIIVVPTGFCTNSEAKIGDKIRQHLVDNNYLRGVIHMPGNIFANTGTSVSLIYIDKDKQDDKVILMDASELGKMVKVDGYQKRELSEEEQEKIVEVFNKAEEVEGFCKVVSNKEIVENNYMLKAGQYFEHVIEESNVNFEERMAELTSELSQLFVESRSFEEEIKKNLGVIGFEM